VHDESCQIKNKSACFYKAFSEILKIVVNFIKSPLNATQSITINWESIIYDQDVLWNRTFARS
jgi:hypothetical protein